MSKRWAGLKTVPYFGIVGPTFLSALAVAAPEGTALRKIPRPRRIFVLTTVVYNIIINNDGKE